MISKNISIFKEKKRNLLLELKKLEQDYLTNNSKFSSSGNGHNESLMNVNESHMNTSTRTNSQWQKSALMICDKFLDHKTGPLFSKIPTYPEYSQIVKSPLSLEIIKQKIRNRKIENIHDFQRDVMLVLANAVMANPELSDVHLAAMEMQKFVDEEFQNFLVSCPQ